MYGRIDVDKPAAMSSHDVVSQIRRRLSEKHVGHSGTLDPMATGVLNIYVGRQATKFIDLLKSPDKAYLADFEFGLTSDTLDIWGETETVFLPQISREKLESCMAGFLGESQQVPPMVSAIKQSGKPLYAYARAGEWRDRAARPIVITKLELLHFDGRKGQFALRCSKGTYVRSLIDDIGRLLGTGAVMSGLRRTENDYVSLEAVTPLEAVSSGNLKPLDRDLPFKRQAIDRQTLDFIRQGRAVQIESDYTDERILLTLNGGFVGTAKRCAAHYQPERMIHDIE